MAYLCWHSIWHSFLSYTLTFYLTLSDILSGIYSHILSGHMFWHSCWHSIWHLTFSLAPGWGSGVPTEIWSSRLRPSPGRWKKIMPESNCSKIRTGWLGSSLQLALGLGKTLCLHVFASWIPALDVWSSICDGLSLVESNIFFVHYPIVWLNLQLQTPIFLKL